MIKIVKGYSANLKGSIIHTHKKKKLSASYIYIFISQMIELYGLNEGEGQDSLKSKAKQKK
jgi:hypothetical protein